jgi:hypothetical protein
VFRQNGNFPSVLHYADNSTLVFYSEAGKRPRIFYAVGYRGGELTVFLSSAINDTRTDYGSWFAAAVTDGFALFKA